jgi:hypothetical protein
VLTRLATQTFLILASLTVCASRLHGQSSLTPAGVTQELNRCLSVVRIAASRRSNGSQGRTEEPRIAIRVSWRDVR